MILEKGNMWDVFGHTDVFFITTNPITRKDGALVMGRGIAKEAKDRFPTLPYLAAERIALHQKHQATSDAMAPTGVGVIGPFDGQLVGYFMVKRHWAEPAELAIIERSIATMKRSLCFTDFVTGERKESTTGRYDLNFPGIGNGKLRREDVLPLLEQLPDNVHVWEYG